MVSALRDDQILALIKHQQTREEGFTKLVQTYQERIYWHVRKFLFDHDDANDVVQNTFIKAYKGLKNFKGHSKLYTWLYRIASNEAITFLNQKNRRQMQSLDGTTKTEVNNLDGDPFFDGDQIQLLLQKAIALLPVKQRLVFNMRYYDELRYEEISEILNTSTGALKASYHHAVKKIEQFFKDVYI